MVTQDPNEVSKQVKMYTLPWTGQIPYYVLSFPHPLQTYSETFRDNFLVQLDIFCHFRGIILCNTKLPPFQRNNNKNVGKQLSKSSIPLCLNFYKFMWLLNQFVLQNFIFVAMAALSFLIDYGWKTISRKISSCINVFNSKNLARPFFVHKFMFVVGYYN